MTHYIYCITNKINNKKYVGQTISLKERWQKHILYGTKSYNYKSKSFAIHSAIHKYGLENFILEILDKCDNLNQSNEKEEFYVAKLNTLAPNGYNLLPGGNNRTLSEETKKKISETLKITGYFIGKKGSLHPNFGTTLSVERKTNLSKMFSGDGSSGKKINSQIARQIYIDYYNDINLSANSLVKIYNLKKGAILNILNKFSWKEATADLPDVNIKERTCGENWIKSKITNEIATNILKDYINNNMTTCQLIKKYNISYGIIHGIIIRKTWKHIKI